MKIDSDSSTPVLSGRRVSSPKVEKDVTEALYALIEGFADAVSDHSLPPERIEEIVGVFAERASAIDVFDLFSREINSLENFINYALQKMQELAEVIDNDNSTELNEYIEDINRGVLSLSDEVERYRNASRNFVANTQDEAREAFRNYLREVVGDRAAKNMTATDRRVAFSEWINACRENPPSLPKDADNWTLN